LGYSVREEGEPHNCLKDAEAAMNLVLAKLKNEFNDPIEIAANSVSAEKKMFLNLTISIDDATLLLCGTFLGN
jgi:RNA exonuclease 1